MYELGDYQLPQPRDRYKPRAEASHLSAIVHHAGHRYAAQLFPETEREAMAAAVSAFLVARSTPEDLAVLRRYGFTETIERASVTIYNPATMDYATRASVDLPAPIEVPRGWFTTTANAPRYSEIAGNGLTDSYRAELIEAGKFESYLQEWRDREAGYLPREWDSYFARIIEAREFERGTYRAATEWPAEYRQREGKWPTWAEIESALPFVGAYLAERRAAALEAAA